MHLRHGLSLLRSSDDGSESESDSEATGTDGTDLGSASEEDDELENEGDEIAIDVK